MSLRDVVLRKLEEVYDPELKENVLKLQLVRDIKVEGEKVSLKFRPTVENCPVGMQLAIAIKKALLSLEGVEDVDIVVENFVWAKETMEFLKALDKK